MSVREENSAWMCCIGLYNTHMRYHHNMEIEFLFEDDAPLPCSES